MIVTPIKDDRVGKVVAVLDRDLTTWRIHAGETKGARTAAEAEPLWSAETQYAEGLRWWRDDAVARQKRIDIAGRPDAGVLVVKSGDGERTDEPDAGVAR